MIYPAQFEAVGHCFASPLPLYPSPRPRPPRRPRRGRAGGGGYGAAGYGFREARHVPSRWPAAPGLLGIRVVLTRVSWGL